MSFHKTSEVKVFDNGMWKTRFLPPEKLVDETDGCKKKGIFHLTPVVFLKYMNVIKHHITIDGAVEGVKKSTVLGK